MAITSKRKLQQAVEPKQSAIDEVIERAVASSADGRVTAPPGPKMGRPANPDRNQWTRQTFVVRIDHLEAVKRAAYWDRKTAKDVLDEALSAYFRDREYEPVPGR